MEYALINNGIVENIIVASPEFVGALTGYTDIVDVTGVNCGIGHAYVEGTFTAPEAEPAKKVTQLTKLEFQLRFTFDELVAIETAAETDAGVRVLQRQQQAAEFISLTDVNTKLGMLYLASKGLLTAERVDAILA